jgi:microsomal dipeptidase-like Zn-dependent dipeptidase
MLGLSLYPLHLRGESECALESFCEMAAKLAEEYGVDGVGLGTDLCQGHGPATLAYMRNGRWNPGGESKNPDWPPPLPWFQSNLDFPNIAAGLAKAGFNDGEVKKIMGENWLRFFDDSFSSGSAAAR